MLVPLLLNTARACAGLTRRSSSLAVVSGLLAGIYVCAWVHALLGSLGTSRAITTSVLTATVIWGLAGLSRQRLVLISNPRIRFGLMHLMLAGWVLIFPWILEQLSLCLAAAGDSWSSSLPGTLLLGLLGGSGALGLGIFGIARLPQLLTGYRQEPSGATQLNIADGQVRIHGSFWLALAIALFLDGLFLAPLLGLQLPARLAAIAGALLCTGCLWNVSRSQAMLEQTLTLPIGDPAVETFPARLLTPIILKTHVLTACIALAAGLLLAVWPRFVEQLVPSTSYLVTSSWSVWLGGIALGCIISTSGRWLGIGASGWRICLSLGLAVWTIALLAAFPWMVYRLVEINSRISQPEFLALIRGLLPSLVLLPTGIVCGLCATKLSLPDTESSAVPNGPRLALPRVFEFLEWPHGYVLLGLAAYGFAQWRLIPDWGVASGLLLAAAILGCGALSQMLFPLTLPQDFRIRGLVAASLAVIASGPVWQANYQPAVSARLLFTTQVLVAVRNGQRPESLPVLDEGRNTVQAEGSRGTYTTWKYSGSQFQIRENGIPKGTVSRDTEVHPNYSAELLQIVVPLVLHERAQRLLILGLGAGVPLRAALASPVREITCAETDPALVKLVGEIVDGSPDAIDWQDERLQLRIVDPALFVATTHQTFDVIISNPNQSALFQGAADYNREFYARVARRLTPQGIFCQRFQFVDYGPGPLRAMVRTLRTTFQDVLALEMAPGELLFVATNDSRGLVRPALLGRLEAPHIRKLLSEVGWDWSLLLTLGAYNRAGLDKFAAQVPGPINSAVNGYFLFRLPREMMSWGYKAQEVHAALSPQMQRLADWIGQDGNKPEVLRRLSEVVAQQNIMAKFPDQYWAYRSQVRQHLTEKRPAGKIQPVSFEAAEEELEPGDQWRVQYFQSLGRAARSKRLDDIERVEEFTSPFDPLVSYFLHMEVAELLHKAEVGDPAGELRHRMHAAYYASPFDASIHNVIDAMRLQVEHPESAADPAQRWDQLNSLLQMLKTRWELRTTLPAGAPKNVLRDLDLSLVAADKVIDHLDQLRAEAGIRENDWSPRRAFLEANLTHPLRIYRANLLAEAKREIKK